VSCRRLQSLINYKYFDPALSNTAGTAKWTAGDPFSNLKYGPVHRYWTSTTVAYNTSAAWIVSMDIGFLNSWYTKTGLGTGCVWPVRGGQ